MREKIIKLKNNGTLIYSKSNLNNSTAVEVGFFCGAYNDTKLGTAHFLEHTLFKKTQNRDNSTIENDRNTIAFLNAMTSPDYVLVNFFRSNKLINESMEFAEDVLMNSIIDDEYLESEKGVITEELNMCLDSESRNIHRLMLKNCQTKALVASDLVGQSPENISNITFEDLKKYKEDFFIGNNFVISVESSLSFSKIKRLVNKYFVKNIPSKESAKQPKQHYKDIRIDKEPSLIIQTNTQEKTTVMISFKLDRNEEYMKDHANYTYIAMHFSGEIGNLFLTLRNKGLIYRLSSNYSCFHTDSLFNIVFETDRKSVV